jgi:hypothetical protein
MMQTHPCANIWPLMTDRELDDLASDIIANGQALPIITTGGLILDGRNRWLACERAGLEPWIEEVETDDPDALAWSLNEHRRHASENVRGMAAAERADMRQGERTDLKAVATKSQGEMARLYGVSRDTVSRARTVLDHGDAAIIAAVKSDDLAVSLAAKAVRRIQETGEGFTSIADLKKTMRAIYREDHPAPASTEPKSPTPPASHVSVDTFGVIRAVVRHAAENPAATTIDQIDKWTRLNILDDLPPAIDYLTELKNELLAREE